MGSPHASGKETRTQPTLTENAVKVLERRYLAKDTAGSLLETPAELFWRVARFIAGGDKAYGKTDTGADELAERFYEIMARLEFLPNSPTLMNADRPLGQLSACFVLPVEDSLDSIFETLKEAALIHQSGGGTGFSFSRLRPKGDIVRSTMGVSSGPVSFMEVYNAATEAIKQGGTRRGANMGVLSIDHPDVLAFIHAKSDLRKVTNFNISVTVTDAFMRGVDQGTDFNLRHPGSGETVQTLPAGKLFGAIVESAWQTGEPGVIFIDAINRDNPTPAVGRIESTNPCGEVPLLPYEACNLGSINLGKMIATDPKSGKPVPDWEKLKETVYLAVHFLDNVITQNRYPIPPIQAAVDGNRKIGLGVMGWADMLITLGIPYDTDEAVQLGREIMAWIDYHGKVKSVALAKERGAFPNFAESRYAEPGWLSGRRNHNLTTRITQKGWQKLEKNILEHGLRNATTTCIAPTGTISIIAGASGGIEPVFALAFTRNVMDNTRMPEVQPQFKRIAEEHGLNQPALLEKITATGSLQGIVEIPEPIRRLFVTSFDIAPDWHVRMQAAFQDYTDNGVSKTINFPESATAEDVARAYHLAYDLGVKGITVYRNNSRQDQPMLLENHMESRPGQATPPVYCIDCD